MRTSLMADVLTGIGWFFSIVAVAWWVLIVFKMVDNSAPAVFGASVSAVLGALSFVKSSTIPKLRDPKELDVIPFEDKEAGDVSNPYPNTPKRRKRSG